MKKIWYLILAVMALAACVKEPGSLPDEGNTCPEGATVTIPFTVSAGDISLPSTKNVTLGEEVPLESLYVAVFGSSGYLKEYVKAHNLSRIADTTYVDPYGESRTVARYQFDVTLTITENKRILHFIGNGPSTLSFGFADAVVSPLLSPSGIGSYWQMDTIPGIHAKRSTVVTEDGYYIDGNGRKVFTGDYIDKDNNKVVDGHGYIPDQATVDAFKGIALIKNWAKIKLEASSYSNFTPYSYAVVNVPARGTIAPYCNNNGFVYEYQNLSFEDLEGMGYSSNLPVGTPFDTTIPSESDFQNFTNGVANAADPESAVYMFERPVPTTDMRPTAVIVYGFYKDPEDPDDEGGYYYYKVDLMEGSSYYPVFRNFQYDIKILRISSRGHHNPAAAYAAAGSADVSADINASHLSDISDGLGRLQILPWMSHTYTKQVTNGELYAFFIDDVGTSVNSPSHMNIDPASVTVEKLPMAYGEADVITSLSIDDPITDVEGSVGQRTIHFTTAEPGITAHTQVIRISADHETVHLYRDVEITLSPIQPMIVRCAKSRISNSKGTSQCVEIVIPEGLAESMFPLDFVIEPERMTLTPDDSKTNNNLPVVNAASISENPDYAGKPSFHFERSLSWAEYRALITEKDEFDRVWRVLPCYFVSNCNNSATTVWVQNEYFLPNHTSFTTFRDLHFRNLKFTTPIKREDGALVSVHFDIDTDPTYNYPEDYPKIILEPFQMEPVSELIPVPNSPGTYYYIPTSPTVDLIFRTTTDDGSLSLDLSAEEYESKTLNAHYFRNFGFINGHKMWKVNGWSNVACNRVNYDSSKNVLFGYYDDPDAPNTEISILDMSKAGDGKPSLNFRYPTSYPWTPDGPRSTSGVATYHEIEFTTPSLKSVDPIEFTLSANGYVQEKVRTNRFSGNILTQDAISTSNVLKPGNDKGFSVDNPSFTMLQDKDKTPTFTLTFNEISDLRSDAPQGVILDGGKTYTITVTSNTAYYYIFYVQLNFRMGYTYNKVKRNLEPAGWSTSAGTFYKYPGDNKQYIWDLPPMTSSATLTLEAPEDYPINITDIIVKTINGTLH